MDTLIDAIGTFLLILMFCSAIGGVYLILAWIFGPPPTKTTPQTTNPALDQHYKTLDLIVEWVRLRGQHGGEWPDSLMRFQIDAEHSALLRRMFEGKPALPVPPPRSYSNPWYDLLETGEGEADDISFGSLRKGDGSEQKVMLINQSYWNIEQIIPEDGGWICSYNYKSGRNDLKTADSRWFVERQPETNGKVKYKIKRMV